MRRCMRAKSKYDLRKRKHLTFILSLSTIKCSFHVTGHLNYADADKFSCAIVYLY